MTDKEKALEMAKFLKMEEKTALDELEQWRFKINSVLLAISATMLSINVATSKLGFGLREVIYLNNNHILCNFCNPALFSAMALVANILCILFLFALVYEHIFVYNRYISRIRKELKQEVSYLSGAYEKGYILQSLKRPKIFSILEISAYFSFLLLVLMLAMKLFLV